MTTKRFHLAWFCNFSVGDWNGEFAPNHGPWDGKFYVEMALAMERACFDYIMLEDTLMVSEAYRGTAEATLKYALQAPKHDPLPLAAMIGAATTNLGVVATMSTMAYPPFMLARLACTLDHICGGRFGWNIVTSGEDAAAQNFGMDELPPREQRYDMADEYVELVVTKLFDSWAPDAVVMDRETRHLSPITPRSIRSISRASIFKCPRPAQHGAVRRRAGRYLRPGGWLAPGARVRGAHRRFSIIATANGHSRHEVVPRRRPRPRGGGRARSRTTSRCCS